jgi:hypothetical protein
MAEFNWLENSKVVFDESLKAAPGPFRGVSKKNLEKGLTKIVGEGGDVREADIVRAIKETTPAPFLALGLKTIGPHLTDPSILDV